MVKKIGIITLNGYFNYGNRLQNYATEQVLKSLGYKVETIINDTSPINRTNMGFFNYFSKIKEMKYKEILMEIKKMNNFYLHGEKLKAYRKKKAKFLKNFSDEYINESDYHIKINDIPEELISKFDFFITGSDQVWNPYYVRKHSSINFLRFAPIEKRIAYAPSFGVTEIPSKDKKNYTNWLSEMKKLSVREDLGAKIIKELTNRRAEVLIDPTMMLKKEEWIKISKKDSKKPKNGFLLIYILGELPKKRKKQIRRFAKENNLDIVNLSMGSDWSDFIIGPSEFIDYFNSASVIFTDSFHGTIFSILFKNPFVTFSRQGSHEMISRINTLLERFKMEKRLESNINLTYEEIMKINFDHIDTILEKERKKTFNYLRAALK
jgi:hypothetical protein